MVLVENYPIRILKMGMKNIGDIASTLGLVNVPSSKEIAG